MSLSKLTENQIAFMADVQCCVDACGPYDRLSSSISYIKFAFKYDPTTNSCVDVNSFIKNTVKCFFLHYSHKKDFVQLMDKHRIVNNNVGSICIRAGKTYDEARYLVLRMLEYMHLITIDYISAAEQSMPVDETETKHDDVDVNYADMISKEYADCEFTFASNQAKGLSYLLANYIPKEDAATADAIRQILHAIPEHDIDAIYTAAFYFNLNCVPSKNNALFTLSAKLDK